MVRGFGLLDSRLDGSRLEDWRCIRDSGDSQCSPMRLAISKEALYNGFVELYLKDSQLMHILVFACRYHILKYTEFLIHLRPSSSFDDRVRRLPGHLLPCRARQTGLLLTCRSGRCGGGSFLSGSYGDRFRVVCAPRVFSLL